MVARIVQMSHLKCKKCAEEFDYKWVPTASFTSLRFGKSRYMKCPICGKWSLFNIWNNKVDPAAHHCEIIVGPS